MHVAFLRRQASGRWRPLQHINDADDRLLKGDVNDRLVIDMAPSHRRTVFEIGTTMKDKTLGHTGLLVSRLCLGTMTFGGGKGIYL